MGFDDVLVRSQFERVDVQFRCSYKKLLSKMNTAQDAWNNDMNTQCAKTTSGEKLSIRAQTPTVVEGDE